MSKQWMFCLQVTHSDSFTKEQFINDLGDKFILNSNSCTSTSFAILFFFSPGS